MCMDRNVSAPEEPILDEADEGEPFGEEVADLNAAVSPAASFNVLNVLRYFLAHLRIM